MVSRTTESGRRCLQCSVASVLGVATDAIHQLGGSANAQQQQINAMSIAFAITYIFGTAGVSAFLALLGPKILGINLAAECKALESAMGGNEPDPSVHSTYQMISVRAYRVTDPAYCGITIAEFESRFPNQRLFVERLRDRKSTRLNSSHVEISYAVFCLKKKK